MGETEGPKPGDGGVQGRLRITRRERELPPESTVWAGAGVAALTIGAGVAVSAALARETEAVLWTIAIAFTVLAATCFLAHWDVNRGRRIRHAEIEEETKFVG